MSSIKSDKFYDIFAQKTATVKNGSGFIYD